MKKVKFGLSLILSFMLILGILPVSAFAAEGEIKNFSMRIEGPLIEGIDGCIDYDGTEFFYYSYEPVFVVEYTDGTVFSGYYYEVSDMVGESILMHDGQNSSHPWGVGKHTVTASVKGMTAECEVEVIENPVQSISAVMEEPLIENISGFVEFDDEEREYFCYFYYPIFTVVCKDGTVCTGDEFEIYEQLPSVADRSIYIYDYQDESPWGLGKHTIEAEFLGATCEFEAEVIKNPVEGIEVKSISAVMEKPLIEKADGMDIGFYDDNDYFWYSYNPIYTVTYENGTVYTGDMMDIYYKTGEYVETYDDQSPNTQWGVGKHTVTAEFSGVSCEFEVEVVESPIKNISVKYKENLVKNVDGYWDYTFNHQTGEYDIPYFYYEYDPIITVEYKDGTSYVGTPSDLLWDTDYLLYTNDGQDIPWELGSHTVILKYMGFSVEFVVNVVEELPEKSDVFVFKIDDENIYYVNQDVKFTAGSAPFMQDGRAVVPLRSIASAVGISDLKYDAATKKITFTGFDGYKVEMQTGSTKCTLTKGSESFELSIVAPFTKDGSAMLPLRDTANLVGGYVKYDNHYIVVSKDAIADADIAGYIAAYDAK